MRRLICFLCVFCLLCSLPLVVYAADTDSVSENPVPELTFTTDYSYLELGEDNKYWVYFKIQGDSVPMSDGNVHSIDMDVYVDVTDWYAKYGHAGIFLDNSYVTTKMGIFFVGYNSSGSGTKYGNNPPARFSGTLDGTEFSVETVNVSIFSSMFNIGYALGIGNLYFDSTSADCFKYIPIVTTSTGYQNDNVKNFDYIQHPPVPLITPNPQEAVFAYDKYSDEIIGLNMILRYPFANSTDFYAKQNRLDYIPLVDQIHMEKVTTYVDFRLTCLIDGESVSTNWFPIGSVPYEKNPVFDYLFSFGSLQPYLFHLGLQQGYDAQYLSMRLDTLPTLLRSMGIHVPDTSKVILTKIEAVTQNYHVVNNVWSDQVYSAYDVTTNTQTTDVFPVDTSMGHSSFPSGEVDENGDMIFVVDMTINVPDTPPNFNLTVTPSGSTDVVPSVNGDGSSGAGSSDFGDSLLQFFQFILDILGTLITGFIEGAPACHVAHW